jgi:signal transduction histidine kinase
LLWPPGARAEEHLRGVEWLEDPSGSLGIEEVQKAPFVARNLPFSGGFSGSTHWFRLRVGPSADGSPLLLRVGPNFLDEVVLYAPDPEHPGQWRQGILGDRLRWAERELLSIIPGFQLPPVTMETTLYLRVRSSSAMILIAEVVTPRVAAQHDVLLHGSSLAFLVVMLVVLAWAAGTWFEDRDPVLTVFIGVQLVFSVQVVALSGFLAVLAPSSWPQLADQAMNLSTVLTTFSVLVLNRALLKPCGLPAWGARALDALLWLLPVLLLLLVAGYTQQALKASALLMFAVVLISPALVLLARSEPVPGRWILFSVMLLQALILAGTRLLVVGAVQSSADGFMGVRLLAFGQGVLNSGLLAVLLALRQRDLHRRAREAERAVRDNASRIEAMSVELERRAVQAEAGNRTKTAFLAIMGHEFRTPINAIVGVAEALLPTLTGPHERELVDTQLGAARGLQSMVEDVLDLARAAGEDAPHREDFSPSRLLGELRERARVRAPGVVLITEADPALPSWLSGDTPRICRVLRHYLDNALKFTREGSITLSVRPEPGETARPMLRFAVRDTGPGIDPALRARLFSTLGPQEEYLRREAGGAGLGLVLVRQLSQVLGGEVGCDSEPGRGSLFWLSVPFLPARGDSPAVAPALAEPQPAAAHRDVQAMDREDFAAALEELRGMLGADDMRASRRFRELEPALAAELPLDVMARLRAQVGDFDFAAAHATIATLDELPLR